MGEEKKQKPSINPKQEHIEQDMDHMVENVGGSVPGNPSAQRTFRANWTKGFPPYSPASLFLFLHAPPSPPPSHLAPAFWSPVPRPWLLAPGPWPWA